VEMILRGSENYNALVILIEFE